MSDQPDRPGHCLCEAYVCCYYACDFEDFVCLNAGTCDCLCIRYATCCALGYDSLGCGMVTNEERNEYCKIGLLCCELGLIEPSTCCNTASQCLCCQHVGSLPFHPDYVSDVVCGMCFIQCAPQCGCCMAPPVAKAFTILKNTQSQSLTASTPMERS